MKVFVICLNDSVEYAIINNENRAKQKMNELKEIHYERSKCICPIRKQYDLIYYWHIHEVAGE